MIPIPSIRDATTVTAALAGISAARDKKNPERLLSKPKRAARMNTPFILRANKEPAIAGSSKSASKRSAPISLMQKATVMPVITKITLWNRSALIPGKGNVPAKEHSL